MRWRRRRQMANGRGSIEARCVKTVTGTGESEAEAKGGVPRMSLNGLMGTDDVGVAIVAAKGGGVEEPTMGAVAVTIGVTAGESMGSTY
jgi:hypothetical protein